MGRDTASHALGKTRRLLASSDFQNVFDNIAAKKHGKYFAVFCTVSSQPNSRLGLIVAKKHVPLAVRRNLLKRISRESFRHRFAQAIDSDKSLDIIVMVKGPSRSATNQQLRQELNRLWQTIGDRCKSPN